MIPQSKDLGSRLFYRIFVIWMICQWFLYMFTTKATAFLWVDHQRSFLADLVFTGFTDLGNGLSILLLIVIVIILRKYHLAIGLLSSFLFSGIVCSLLKSLFHHLRPAAWPHTAELVRTASWIRLDHKNSFPSGHTVSAFAAAMTLSLYFSHRRWVSVIVFIVAVLIAYSRVYLGEHFIEDTWLGSFVGVFGAVVCFNLQRIIQIQFKTTAKAGLELGESKQ